MPASSIRKHLDLEEVRAAMQVSDGRGVKVAVIDSGIENSHEDLHGLSLRHDLSFVMDGQFIRSQPNEDGDAIGHGTAVASVLLSLAPGVEVGSFRVLDADLRSRSTFIWEAARQALSLGYQILNCSFGSPADGRFVMAYKEWLDLAYMQNVHVVAGSNNHDVSTREWPGWFTSVNTVQLVNCAPDVWLHCPDSLVDFGAHGWDVPVAWKGGGRRVVTGSSYAAPRVTAWLARLIHAFPELTVDEAKALLRLLALPEEEK